MSQYDNLFNKPDIILGPDDELINCITCDRPWIIKKGSLHFCHLHLGCRVCYSKPRMHKYTNYCLDCYIAYKGEIQQQQEPYYGYKIFTFEDGYLNGGFGYKWKKTYLHFQCLDGADRELFDCFTKDHGCGIYVYKNIFSEQRYGILAKVVCWGEVIEHTEGARASDVEILELIINTPHIDWCQKLKHYGIPITCAPDSHFLDGSIYLYGGAVRAMFQKGIPIKDYDVLVGWDTFLDRGVSFNRGGGSRNKEDKWGEWWHKHYLTGKLALGNNIVVDATILGGQPTLSLEEAKELLANTIDYRCNAVIYYNGEFHEAIPGGLDDLKHKRFIQVNPEVADWREQHIIKWASKWGWTVNGSLYLDTVPLVSEETTRDVMLNPTLGISVGSPMGLLGLSSSGDVVGPGTVYHNRPVSKEDLDAFLEATSDKVDAPESQEDA